MPMVISSIPADAPQWVQDYLRSLMNAHTDATSVGNCGTATLNLGSNGQNATFSMSGVSFLGPILSVDYQVSWINWFPLQGPPGPTFGGFGRIVFPWPSFAWSDFNGTQQTGTSSLIMGTMTGDAHVSLLSLFPVDCTIIPTSATTSV